MQFDECSHRVIGCALEVHRVLGPGLLESAYERCLSHELTLQGIRHTLQIDLPILYKGLELDCGYRIDVIVDDLVVLELKAVERLLPVHEAQLMTYLTLMRKPIGLLINFNVARLRDGLKRIVL